MTAGHRCTAPHACRCFVCLHRHLVIGALATMIAFTPFSVFFFQLVVDALALLSGRFFVFVWPERD